jgi:hypothetical protein
MSDNNKELEEKAAEEQEQSPHFYLARDKIRECLDPTNSFITDDEIYHTLLVCGGDIRRTVHKCILSIQAKALRNKDGAVVTWSRDRLRFHEAGLLIK